MNLFSHHHLRHFGDCYRCLECGAIAAHGNRFCRGCGVSFTVDMIKVMKDLKRVPIIASPINLRDSYRCIHCLEFIGINDCYCRQCGDHIDDSEKQLMKSNLKDLTRQNILGVLGMLGFVISVIIICILNIL